eukprot:CAMPEP_0168328860 /NCGR_PEP_ID=MMETSP0213-20121227/6763_1 /TAXON_ID=151035 /ORGANISM="Euplotes harpa, Strain FSP1.4" /LENGTH=266 /DNA_ID=CAMNT_0008332073 /DNA_START=613 /DNA_END=1410 /DNA_ORIENTATION=-
MRSSEYTCYSISNTDEHQTQNDNCNELIDDIGFKRNPSFEYEKECSHYSDKEGKHSSGVSGCKRLLEKQMHKYFSNNYDYLPVKGPIFEVKKLKKHTRNRLISLSNRKRRRIAELSPNHRISSWPVTKTSDGFPAQEPSKNTEKKGSKVSVGADHDSDPEVYHKENFHKLAKDIAVSSKMIPEEYSTSILTAQKNKEKSREDKKIENLNKCIFSYKKVSKDSEDEQSKKAVREDFKDLLFNNSDDMGKLNKSSKNKLALKEDSIAL